MPKRIQRQRKSDCPFSDLRHHLLPLQVSWLLMRPKFVLLVPDSHVFKHGLRHVTCPPVYTACTCFGLHNCVNLLQHMIASILLDLLLLRALVFPTFNLFSLLSMPLTVLRSTSQETCISLLSHGWLEVIAIRSKCLEMKCPSQKVTPKMNHHGWY